MQASNLGRSADAPFLPILSGKAVMYRNVSASGAFSSVPVANYATGSDAGPPPEFQTLSAEMTMACSSARWDAAQPGPSEAPPHESSLLEPQRGAGQEAEASTDSYRGPSCGTVTADMFRSLVAIYGLACKTRDGDPSESVETWRRRYKVEPADLADLWRDGNVMPMGRVLLAYSQMGPTAWRKRGKELIKLCEAVDTAKRQGKRFVMREWSREHKGIPFGSLPCYVQNGVVVEYARLWAKEVRKLERNQESTHLGESPRLAREVLPAPVAKVSSVNEVHRTTPSPLQFSDVLPQDTNFAWWGTPSLRFAPTQPLLSSDAMMFVDA